MRSRRQNRSRGGPSGGRSLATKFIYFGIIGFLVVGFVMGAGAFTTSDMGRIAEVGGASDKNALLGLSVSESVTVGERDKLVTITNQLNQPTIVTVSLTNQNDGTLYGDGSGDQVEISLDSGESKTIEIKAEATGEACSGTETSKSTTSFKVTFLECSYDSNTDETTYEYRVEGIGNDSPEYKDLSHIVFGVPSGFQNTDVVDTSPADTSELMLHKDDPTTGVSGVKWDESVSKTEGNTTFTYTVDGRHGSQSTVDVGLKAGPNTPTVKLPGPSTQADGTVGGTITFEITATTTTDDTVISLTRNTEKES